MIHKNILITGASEGFGERIAATLVDQGYTVVGTSRRAKPLKAITPRRLNMMPLDVDEDVSVEALYSSLKALDFKPDAIILNAGFGVSGSLEESSTHIAKAQFETNFFGVHRMVHNFMSLLRETHGRLIVVGSISGVIGIPFQGLYSASKFALEGYVDALSLEVAMHGVQVSMIQPGDFNTKFGENREFLAANLASPYEPFASAAINIMSEDENNGGDPQVLADTVVVMLAAKKMKRRYLIGSLSECLVTKIYHFLPYFLREFILRTTYKIPPAK